MLHRERPPPGREPISPAPLVPNARNEASRHAAIDGTVLSSTGITTRNLDQASHATHNVTRPSTTFGAWPRSLCIQSPGSTPHRRCTLRLLVAE